jgi:CubicO group peptidase (beta-lactamase class C family)
MDFQDPLVAKEETMKTFRFKEVLNYLRYEVETGLLPGAVIAVGDSDDLFLKEAIGYSSVYPARKLMTTETIFDIASLTKVVGTLTSIMILVQRGELSLDDSISRFFPVFIGTSKEQISIYHLLTHTSGIPLKMDFTEDHLSREDIFNYIANKDLEFIPGKEVLYSDLGFILLGFLIEEISGETLADFTRNEIFHPLKMFHTQYTPPCTEDMNFASTEYRRYLQRYQVGEVHDRTAGALGGISGHAGLFSTIDDLINFAACYLRGGDGLLKLQTIQEMIKNHTPYLNNDRGLGWEVYKSGGDSFAGCFQTDCFGHTGFTGTSLVLNLEQNFFVLLLSNRIHFGRRDDIVYIRRKVHELVHKSLESGGLNW